MQKLCTALSLLLVAAAPLALQHASAAAPAPVVAAVDEVPDKRPEVKALVDEFNQALKARGEKDAEAIEVIAKFLGEFEASGPKDRESMAKALGDSLGEKRKDLGSEEPDQRVAMAAAAALGRMGEVGGKVAQKNLDHKNLRDKPKARRELILAVGTSGYEPGIKDLIDLLKNFDAAIQAAAAESLGHFANADEKQRKQIFKALLETIMPVKNTVDSDTTDQEARKRLDTISTPVVGSMKSVSRHDEPDLQSWQRWWNHNKNEDWKDA